MGSSGEADTATANAMVARAVTLCAVLLAACLILPGIARAADPQDNPPPPPAASQAATAFTLEQVADLARKLAANAYQPPKDDVPDWLTKISYDQWRNIHFDASKALWRGDNLPFHVQFYHPGASYNHTVKINIISDGKVLPTRFSPVQFDYGKNDFRDKVPPDLGYAGFRIHYALNEPGHYVPVASFLGATYFQAIGRGQDFGLSARGLAIDTGLSSGEEFPWFREFWLKKPEPDAQQMTVYALLDSPSITGAYRFVIRPGDETIVNVECKLFRRKKINKLGIAPLTSMFLFGENRTAYSNDFRPEVHNSDGLLTHSSDGEWMWRPLVNPAALQINDFSMDNPRGFGLMQRDRNFDHYQDLNAHFERRPSAWVEPRGDWGKGHVELVQIPSGSQDNDNIVAMWVPEALPDDLGKPLHFVYELHWLRSNPDIPPGGRTVATRRQTGGAQRSHKFVIDFNSETLRKLPADANVQAVVNVDPGWKLLSSQVVKNAVTGGWRLTAVVQAQNDKPLEMRAYLQQANNTLTETWTYTVNP